MAIQSNRRIFTSQALTTAGSVTLGDATGDTLTINTGSATIPNNLTISGGSLMVGNTTAADRKLHAETSDAGTNTTTYAARFTHVTTDTATTSFGVGIEAELENASGTNKVVGALDWIFTDATNATEDADLVVKLMAAGAAAAEKFRVASTGVATVSFADAGTNAVANVLALKHNTSGTATTGFGIGLNATIENASGTDKIVGTLDWSFTDATNATEDADFIVNLMAGGAVAAEKFRVASTGIATFSYADAATNTSASVLALKHNTSGTATTAFGVGLSATIENASGTDKTVGKLDFVFSDATNATEDGDLVVSLMTAGAAAAEKFRIVSTGDITLAGTTITVPAAGVSVSGGIFKPTDGGAQAIGWVDFTGASSDTNTVTINSRVYEFDTNSSITGDVAVDTSGGASATQSATALVTAINADSSRVVDAVRDGDTVMLVAKAAGSTNYTLAKSGANIVVAAGTFVNASAVTARGIYSVVYTATAADNTVTTDTNGAIIIAGLPSTTAPTRWVTQVRDANGVVKVSANIKYSWVQANTNFHVLKLIETQNGASDVAASDTFTTFVYV